MACPGKGEIGARLGSTRRRLAAASPRAITVAIGASDLVRVVANGPSGSLGARVAVLLDNVDGLGDDNRGGGVYGLVVEDDSVLRSLEAAVDIEGVIGTVAVGVLRVKVPVDHLETPPVVEVSDLVVADRAVGSTEAGGDGSDDLPEGVLHELDLPVELLVVQVGDVRVRPGVRADLVTTGVAVSQSLDRGVIVDAAVVVSVHKEGSLAAGSVERVDKPTVLRVRPVVKGDRHALGRVAARYDTVHLCALLEILTVLLGLVELEKARFVELVRVDRHLGERGADFRRKRGGQRLRVDMVDAGGASSNERGSGETSNGRKEVEELHHERERDR